MVINYLGGGSFKLQSGETSILIDPENNRFKADAVLRTLSPAASFAAGSEPEAQSEIGFSGEYEIKGIEILGVPVADESSDKFVKTVYSVNWEDIRLVFLGHLSKPPSDDIIDKLGDPDVLFLPIGGEHFLEPEVAAKLAKQFEPSFVIPTFYKKPADFLKAMGQKVDFQEKLVFKKKDLEPEGNRVVLLEAKNT